jgi:long-chain acyl-CoA synthetase
MILEGFDQLPTLKKIIVMDREFKSSDERVISMRDLENIGIEWKKDSKNYDAYIARRDGVVLMIYIQFCIHREQQVRAKGCFNSP